MSPDITKTATGLDGATVDDTATPSDNVAIASSSCVPASGSTFPVGTTTVTCAAADAAGNVGTAMFDVTVDVSDGSVDTLIDEIEDLGLPGGLRRVC